MRFESIINLYKKEDGELAENQAEVIKRLTDNIEHPYSIEGIRFEGGDGDSPIRLGSFQISYNINKDTDVIVFIFFHDDDLSIQWCAEEKEFILEHYPIESIGFDSYEWYLDNISKISAKIQLDIDTISKLNKIKDLENYCGLRAFGRR